MKTVAAPETLDDALSPEWLTAALGTRFPGVQVTGVTCGPVDDRVSTNAQFRITCADPVPEGLPTALCIKGYFGDTGRMARPAGLAETCFYRDLAGRAGIRTLQSLYADVDPDSGHGVVVTADVVAQGGTFPDPRVDWTADQVADSLGELAKLHAATWCDPACKELPWLTPRIAQTVEGRGVHVIVDNLAKPSADGLPDEVRRPDRIVAAVRAVAAEVATDSPWCVMHGDTHAGNLFRDSDGKPGFLDWQLVQRGASYVDVGYHIASTLGVDERRRSESDLLRHYRDRLAAAGVDTSAHDDRPRLMARGIVYGLFLWSITSKVDPAITTVLLRRLGAAAADHDALSL